MPRRLLRYDPADWPDPPCHPECAYWNAVSDWRRDNPVDLDDPSDSNPLVVDGPNVPFEPRWAGAQLVDVAHNRVI